MRGGEMRREGRGSQASTESRDDLHSLSFHAIARVSDWNELKDLSGILCAGDLVLL